MQVDIFALGASLLELAAGAQLPQKGDQWQQLRTHGTCLHMQGECLDAISGCRCGSDQVNPRIWVAVSYFVPSDLWFDRQRTLSATFCSAALLSALAGRQ